MGGREPFLVSGVSLWCRPGRCGEEVHVEGLRRPKGDPKWKPDLNSRGLSRGCGGLATEAPREGMQAGAA